jgi:nucleotide-binding universal stress UspA family protein
MSRSPVAVETILCPTDFSVFSSRALRHAVALAKQLGARLDVVHVTPGLRRYAGDTLLPNAVAELVPAMRREAEADARRFVEPAIEARVPVEIEIRDGEPWREILSLAERRPADLVVLGTHGRSGFERFVLGSVTEKLLRLLPCPVMTVCHEEGRTWEAPSLVRRVLCATDLGETSRITADFAAELAARHGAALTLLHVVEELPGTAGSICLPGVGPLKQELERVAASRLDEAARELGERFDVQVDEKLGGGKPYRGVLEAAARESADLIVLGPSRHALGRLLVGSNVHHVIREATCPVIVARPTPERKPSHTTAGAVVLKTGT